LRVIRCPTLQVSQFLFPGQRSDTFLTDHVYTQIIIEAGSKKEIGKLGEKMGEKFREELDVKIHGLRNPGLVMLGIPEETTMGNARETLMK